MKPSRENERWLVTGATGQLGAWAVNELQKRPDAAIFALSRSPFPESPNVTPIVAELDDLETLQACFAQNKPTHVLHFGAMTAVGECFQNPDRADVVNVQATQLLARMTVDAGARFLFSSTDMVFDGNAAPYVEASETKPLSHYGRTKAAAEEAVLNCGGTVVRPPLMYGFPRVTRQTTFVRQMEQLKTGEPLSLFHDEFRTPAALEDVAQACVTIARSDFSGIIHVPGYQRLSRLGMVQNFADVLGLPQDSIQSVSRTSINFDEPRAADLSLNGDLLKQKFPEIAMRGIGPDTVQPVPPLD